MPMIMDLIWKSKAKEIEKQIGGGNSSEPSTPSLVKKDSNIVALDEDDKANKDNIISESEGTAAPQENEGTTVNLDEE